jgi:hypothetical protein
MNHEGQDRPAPTTCQARTFPGTFATIHTGSGRTARKRGGPPRHPGAPRSGVTTCISPVAGHRKRARSDSGSAGTRGRCGGGGGIDGGFALSLGGRMKRRRSSSSPCREMPPLLPGWSTTTTATLVRERASADRSDPMSLRPEPSAHHVQTHAAGAATSPRFRVGRPCARAPHRPRLRIRVTLARADLPARTPPPRGSSGCGLAPG